jgi:hypothetical protein
VLKINKINFWLKMLLRKGINFLRRDIARSAKTGILGCLIQLVGSHIRRKKDLRTKESKQRNPNLKMRRRTKKIRKKTKIRKKSGRKRKSKKKRKVECEANYCRLQIQTLKDNMVLFPWHSWLQLLLESLHRSSRRELRYV